MLKGGGSFVVFEADRHCTPAAARRFVSYWRYVMPGAKRFAASYFRRFVAGQGMEINELGRLLGEAGFIDLQLHRDPELPFVSAVGLKPGGVRRPG